LILKKGLDIVRTPRFLLTVLPALAMILLAAGLIVDPVIRFPSGKSPFRDISGFDALVKHANTLLEKDKTAAKALAVDRWTFGSRLSYYNLKGGSSSQVYVVQNRQDQFRYWQKHSFVQLRGSDLLFLVFSYEHKPLQASVSRGGYRDAGRSEVDVAGMPIYSVHYQWCNNFEGFRD
jgi:hypothetical protein